MKRGNGASAGIGPNCGSGGNGPVPLARYSLFGVWWLPFHTDHL